MTSHAKYLALALAAAALSSCGTLTLERVDFAWPVESVVTVDNGSRIEENRYALTLNVARLAGEEFQDTTALRGASLRLLRNGDGFYFVTGARFKNVYVFASGEHELRMKSKIAVTATGLHDPALNQRTPYVELVDGDTFKKLLTSDNLVEGTH